ncbi:hypothetical protein AW736_16155 [Termitidicoccus mucosus]|uniref:Flagellar protein FliT n=1 Tax=Termitidicoccus mucosus TaxID=1184151 RepID=A0A178IFU8_9BACT|nr:hypothetical protein AW736_16155 [Opitutaceae bacterium TSB47]
MIQALEDLASEEDAAFAANDWTGLHDILDRKQVVLDGLMAHVVHHQNLISNVKLRARVAALRQQHASRNRRLDEIANHERQELSRLDQTRRNLIKVRDAYINSE